MTDQNVKRNIVVLALAQCLGAASPPIVISLGGIVGQMLSPVPSLVTLPVSLFNLGLALGILPAAMVMRQLGRRIAYLFGACIGLAAGLIAAVGITTASFTFFCAGTLAAGFYGSYVQSYRFAATDGAAGAMKPKAISWVMVGGLAASVIGPQLVIWTRDAVPGAPFAGSFLSQGALALLSLPVLLVLRSSRHEAGPQGNPGSGRPLREILVTPRFMLAAGSGIVSYGLMSFVMTAAPIAMVGCGFTVGEAAFGIQWHVLAMFAPSFFTGSLIARFGKERVTAAGLLLLGLSGVVALSGLELGHFYVSLILLGTGWNFGFIGATAMVADSHSPEERAKVQAANDFIIFGSVAAASFFSGSLLGAAGWHSMNWIIFPIIALALVPLLCKRYPQPSRAI